MHPGYPAHPGRAVHPGDPARPGHPGAGTGSAALAGGVLLAAAPDGSLLQANPRVLAGSPFPDWRAPGVLLATLVGGGFLVAGWWQLADHRHARELSVLAGAGLIAFEAAELGWIGFQPLRLRSPWSGGCHRPGLAQVAGMSITLVSDRGWPRPAPGRPGQASWPHRG